MRKIDITNNHYVKTQVLMRIWEQVLERFPGKVSGLAWNQVLEITQIQIWDSLSLGLYRRESRSR